LPKTLLLSVVTLDICHAFYKRDATRQMVGNEVLEGYGIYEGIKGHRLMLKIELQ
jgi:hypothetical protein